VAAVGAGPPSHDQATEEVRPCLRLMHPDDERFNGACKHEVAPYSSVANCATKAVFGTKVRIYELNGVVSRAGETQGGVMTTLKQMVFGSDAARDPLARCLAFVCLHEASR